MKTMLVLAAVGLMVAVVSAHGGGGGGGGDRSRDRDGYGGFNCVCGTQCAGNTGMKNNACRKTRTQYLQCQEAVCSIQSCAANELFNATSLLCQACPAGQHVDARNKSCVCDIPTTWDSKTRTCSGKCPTGSVQTVDQCKCAFPQVVNKGLNACQVCPDGTARDGKRCACAASTPQLFWDEVAFTCKPCPGQWVTVTKTDRRGRPYTQQVCQCPTATDAFNKRTVSCVTCPAGSTVNTNRDGCRVCTCTAITQVYDELNNVCADRATFVRDSSSHH